MHLVAKWLPKLEKFVEKYSTGSNEAYRLYISAEPSATAESHIIPQGVLQASIKITNEPPSGMMANLHKALDNFTQVKYEAYYLICLSWLFYQTVWSFNDLSKSPFNSFPNKPWFLPCLQYKSFVYTVQKGVIAWNVQFLLFLVFSSVMKSFLPFSSNLILSSANSFS